MKTIIASTFIALGLVLSASVQAATPVVSGQQNIGVTAATNKVKPAKKNKRIKRTVRKTVTAK